MREPRHKPIKVLLTEYLISYLVGRLSPFRWQEG
ncbi:hypothetical protein LINPERHAP1_LOCUS31556 [Linum perenne]